MRIILIGIPGAGKSTQGNLLSKQLKLPYLSTGHIFRTLAKSKTTQGRYIKEMLHSGQLIPDKKALPIVKEYLEGKAYKRGYILDGFPRTVAQAEQFADTIDKVIYLTLDDKDALWRIAYRTEERDDQAAATIINRIEIFHRNTDPVTDFFKQKDVLETIVGTGTIEEVNEAILRALGKSNINNVLKPWAQRKRIIFAVTGLSGAGKSHVAEYLHNERDIPILHFGKAVTDAVEAKGLDHTENNHRKIRNEFRTSLGMEALATLNKDALAAALEASRLAVIDDLHSFEEYTFIQKAFPEAQICIIAVWADKETRYSRIKSRDDRPRLVGQDRDIHELIETNMGTTIAFADYIVENNGDLEDLYSKVEHIFREVYYDIDSEEDSA